jgi:tetratricopeptide (TPR) repeat protein
VDGNGVLVVGGDNHVFPVIYGRIVEGMREDVRIYDRHNIFYRIPHMGGYEGDFHGSWKELQTLLELALIPKMEPFGVFFAVFNPNALDLPEGFHLVPYGILSRVVKDGDSIPAETVRRLWADYRSEGFFGPFTKDYMNRQVCGHFYFSLGKYFIAAGRPEQGLKNIRTASRLAYNDRDLHSDLAVFLTEMGRFDEAERELEAASVYSDDPGVLHNNWGYLYFRKGDYPKAVSSLRKAVAHNPKSTVFLNNLANALLNDGLREEAGRTFRRSLALKNDQPAIRKLLTDKGL